MAKGAKPTDLADEATGPQPVCGIIMPIAGNDTYSSDHWASVRDIIERSIIRAEMTARAVWLGGDAEIIHRRIIFNLYQCDFAICDVSSWNPNVMFELGIRLTFNKPTLVISDGANRPLFDIGLIEHIPYPKDLNFHGIESFIDLLSEKLGTTKSATDAGAYRSFIDELGPFDVVIPKSTDVSPSEFALEQLQSLAAAVSRLERKIDLPRSAIRGAGGLPKPPRSVWSVHFPPSLGDKAAARIDGLLSASVLGFGEAEDHSFVEIAVASQSGSPNDRRLRELISEFGGEVVRVSSL